MPINTSQNSFSSTTSHLEETYDISLGTAKLVPVLQAPKPVLVLKHPPKSRTQTRTPLIPEKFKDRDQVSNGASVLPPILSSISRSVGKVDVQWSSFDSDSESEDEEEEGKDEDEDEKGKDLEKEQKAQEEAEAHMRFLHSEWAAGRLFSSPLSCSSSEYEYDVESENVNNNKDAAEIFDLSTDGQRFRNPFLEERDGEVDATWLENIVEMVDNPFEEQRETSSEAIEKAISDESILGYPLGVSPKDTLARTRAEDEHASHFSDDDSESEIDGSEDEEILNTVGEQWPVPLRDWAAWPADKRFWTTAKSCSTHRLEIPGMLSVSDIEEVIAKQQFVFAAIDFFAGFEVETLVADSQISGYQLEDSVDLKGVPHYHKLDPHEPKMGCGCYWCERHHHPSLDDFPKHDPNEWCHCQNCEMFCENEKRKKKEVEEERARIEQDDIWKARMAKLNAEVRSAELAGERRELDSMDYLENQGDGDDFKPEERRGLGSWVRRILRRSSA